MKGTARTALIATIAVTFGMGAVAGLSAHHAVAATYRVDERVTIEGEIVELGYRNPHSYLHVVAPDGDRVRRWAVIWGSRDSNRGFGVPTVLRVGDHVVVTGSPGRDPGTFQILMQAIVRPADGWRWSGPVR
jgi:hypothetical protein